MSPYLKMFLLPFTALFILSLLLASSIRIGWFSESDLTFASIVVHGLVAVLLCIGISRNVTSAKGWLIGTLGAAAYFALILTVRLLVDVSVWQPASGALLLTVLGGGFIGGIIGANLRA